MVVVGGGGTGGVRSVGVRFIGLPDHVSKSSHVTYDVNKSDVETGYTSLGFRCGANKRAEIQMMESSVCTRLCQLK